MNDKKDDIFSRVMRAAGEGVTVTISLRDRRVTVGNEVTVDGGHVNGTLGVDAVDEVTALSAIEAAFAAYERSVPFFEGEVTSRWFHALNVDRLTDTEIATGDDRTTARCRVEMLTLAYILNGSLRADGPMMRGKWFWQSKAYPNLVLLTEWMRN